MGEWGACRSFLGRSDSVRSRGVAGTPAEWGAPHAVGAGGKTFPPPYNSIVAPGEDDRMCKLQKFMNSPSSLFSQYW